MEVKKVYTNKELRDTLESLNLNDDTIDLIEIDGNPVQIMQEPKRINFSLAKRSNNSLGDLTNFTFRVGPTASTGETSVGVCLKYLELEKA